jgi:hypothetical protein
MSSLIIGPAEEPTCPTHGKMQAHVFYGMDGAEGGGAIAQAIDYTCAGFDGEGCNYTAGPEYRVIGYADEINFQW